MNPNILENLTMLFKFTASVLTYDGLFDFNVSNYWPYSELRTNASNAFLFGNLRMDPVKLYGRSAASGFTQIWHILVASSFNW